jgi:hypothetical protein
LGFLASDAQADINGASAMARDLALFTLNPARPRVRLRKCKLPD